MKLTRIVFLIRSLNQGGAERQLVELAKNIDKDLFEVYVVTFYRGGEFAEELRRADKVNLIQLGKRRRWDVAGFLWKLFHLLKEISPDIIYSFLVVPNIVSLVIGKTLRSPKIIWGIRASNMDLSRYDWLASITYKCERWLSRFPDVIITNSKAGFDYYKKMGGYVERMQVIYNGIDTTFFFPGRDNGKNVRQEWGVGKQELLVGLIGRLDPMKGHPTFFEAVKIILRKRNDVRFVCVGNGPEVYLQELKGIVRRLGIGNKLIWAGARRDMPKVYNALDILISSSYGEGFPNVVGEAMACGVPCVVTDVGDSAAIVGGTGIVVPPKSPERLAEGIAFLLNMGSEERKALGAKARERIVETFSVEKMVQEHQSVFKEMEGKA